MNINLTLSCVFHFPRCYKVIERLGPLHIRATTLNGWNSSGLSSLQFFQTRPFKSSQNQGRSNVSWYNNKKMPIYISKEDICVTQLKLSWNLIQMSFFRLYKPLSMLLRWNLKENIDRGKRNFLIWKALIMFAPPGTFYAIKRHYICILKRHFIETCHRGISGSFQTPA